MSEPQNVPGTSIPIVPETSGGADQTPDITPDVRDDIRYLGAILGDIVREQEGEEIFRLVEDARRSAFAIR